MSPAAAPADPVLFGDGKVESSVDLNAAGLAEAFPFLASSSGTASSITVYVDSPNRAKTLIAGLYSNANGHPGALLSSGSLGSLTPRAWNTVAVKSTAVSSGSEYWVVVLGTGGTFWFRDRANGPCEGENSAQRNLTALPSSWSDGRAWSTCPISAYVSGTLSTTTSPPPPPSNTGLPQVSGTDTQGDTLSTSNGSWSGSPTGYRYAWQDCDSSGNNCTAITGAGSSSYTLAGGDVGHTVRAAVTATNTGGSTAAASAQTAAVADDPPAPPSNTSPPTITGTPQQGDTLTAHSGTWSGDTPMSYTYAWSDGTTGSTDTLGASDVGQTISATVTATNDGGSASAQSANVGPVTDPPSLPPPPSGCTTTLTAGSSITAAVNAASSGDTICLQAGTYSGGTINGDNFTSTVTVQSADGTRDAVLNSGLTIDNSSNITLQGLDIEGGGIGGDGGVAFEGSSGSDYTLNNDTIANSDYGVLIGSSNGAISNVTVTHSTLHNFDFSGSSAGTGGGQGVSCYWCSGYTHVNHDIFYAASWHYIQCGGCDNFIVDHNLFSCPCNQHSGAHLNVFQIWQGGSNDQFTNNIVIGNPSQVGTNGEICGGCVLFENGPGGGTAGDGFTNYNVSNNLFVNSGGSLPIQVQTTTGGTVSNNTVADGFQYGIAIGYNSVTGVQSTNLNSQYNIVAGQTDTGQAYRYGAASGTSDHNIADSHGGTSGTGSLNGWAEAWQTTTWSNPLTTPMPAGYYQPASLGSTFGYQGSIGP